MPLIFWDPVVQLSHMKFLFISTFKFQRCQVCCYGKAVKWIIWGEKARLLADGNEIFLIFTNAINWFDLYFEIHPTHVSIVILTVVGIVVSYILTNPSRNHMLSKKKIPTALLLFWSWKRAEHNIRNTSKIQNSFHLPRFRILNNKSSRY